jgi:hypothetical protein
MLTRTKNIPHVDETLEAMDVTTPCCVAAAVDVLYQGRVRFAALAVDPHVDTR